MKYALPLLIVVIGLVVGAAGVVHGEADDSPGLQLLGALLALSAVVYGVRTARRSD